MARENAANDFLSRRCFLCTMQFSRIQELNAHFRQQHGDVWPGVTEKAIQLSNLYADEPPCVFCGALFRTHTCPVFTQLSVMLLYGAMLDEPVSDQLVQPTRQRCEIYLQQWH